jgi:hypothetical protein
MVVMVVAMIRNVDIKEDSNKTGSTSTKIHWPHVATGIHIPQLSSWCTVDTGTPMRAAMPQRI